MKALAVIALCLLALPLRADVTVGHGLSGFALSASVAKLSGCDNQTSRVIGIVGGILGMLPDVAGAVGNVQGDRWQTYGRWHRGDLAISFLPPIRLHLAIDGLYHKPGGGWAWDRWPLFVTIFVVEAVLAYLVWQWTAGK